MSGIEEYDLIRIDLGGQHGGQRRVQLSVANGETDEPGFRARRQQQGKAAADRVAFVQGDIDRP